MRPSSLPVGFISSASDGAGGGGVIGNTPTAPVLSSDPIGLLGVSLTWTASSVVGSSIEKYVIYRSVNGGAFSVLTSVSGSILAYQDAGLDQGTYAYQVYAISAGGVSSLASNIATEILETFYRLLEDGDRRLLENDVDLRRTE